MAITFSCNCRQMSRSRERQSTKIEMIQAWGRLCFRIYNPFHLKLAIFKQDPWRGPAQDHNQANLLATEDCHWELPMKTATENCQWELPGWWQLSDETPVTMSRYNQPVNIPSVKIDITNSLLVKLNRICVCCKQKLNKIARVTHHIKVKAMGGTQVSSCISTFL